MHTGIKRNIIEKVPQSYSMISD